MALPLFFGTCTFSHLCDELVMWSSNKWMSFIFSHLELKKYSLRLVFLKIIWNSLCKKISASLKKGLFLSLLKKKIHHQLSFSYFHIWNSCLTYLDNELKRYQFYFYMYILYHNSNHMILFSLSKIIPLYDFLFLRISKSGNDCEKKCSMTTWY